MNSLVHNKNLIAQDIPFLQSIRNAGKKNFAMPSKKQEYWQYTKLPELNLEYAIPSQSDFDINFSGYKIFFENGFFAPKYSALPEGIEVLPLIEAIMQGLCDDCLNSIATPKDFVNLNSANIQEGVFIHVSKNVNFKNPIAIINNSTSNNTWSATRNIVVIEDGASLELAELFYGSSNHFNSVVNEFYIKDNAKLNHYKFGTSFGVSNTFVDAKKDGIYNNWTLQKDAYFSRNEVVINLLEEGATANINALYKLNNSSIADNTFTVNHKASNTTSNQLVKGVLNDASKGVYQGKIAIDKFCDNVNGNQQHRAVLLSDNAGVDVKPELEIYNDDVKCSHGSAIGKLDEKALFYMQSRGICLKEAKQLLIKAFLQEIVENIPSLDIKESFLLAI